MYAVRWTAKGNVAWFIGLSRWVLASKICALDMILGYVGITATSRAGKCSVENGPVPRVDKSQVSDEVVTIMEGTSLR